MSTSFNQEVVDKDGDGDANRKRIEQAKFVGGLFETEVWVKLSNIEIVEHALRNINDNNTAAKKEMLVNYGYRKSTGLLSVCYRPMDKKRTRPSPNSKIDDALTLVDGLHRLQALKQLVAEGNGEWNGFRMDGWINVILFTPSAKEPISNIELLRIARLLNDISSSYFDMSLEDRLWSVMSHIENMKKDGELKDKQKKLNQSAISRSIHENKILGDISYRQIDRHVRVGFRMSLNEPLRKAVLSVTNNYNKIGLEHLSSSRLIECEDELRIRVMMACVVALVTKAGGCPGSFALYKETFFDYVSKTFDAVDGLCKELSITVEECLGAVVEQTKELQITALELIAERMKTFNPFVKDMEKGHVTRTRNIINKIRATDVCQVAVIRKKSSCEDPIRIDLERDEESGNVDREEVIEVKERMNEKKPKSKLEIKKNNDDDKTDSDEDFFEISRKRMKPTRASIRINEKKPKSKLKIKKNSDHDKPDSDEDFVEISRKRMKPRMAAIRRKINFQEPSKGEQEYEQRTPPSIGEQLQREQDDVDVGDSEIDETKQREKEEEKRKGVTEMELDSMELMERELDHAGLEVNCNWMEWTMSKRRNLFVEVGNTLPMKELDEALKEVEAKATTIYFQDNSHESSPRAPYDDVLPQRGKTTKSISRENSSKEVMCGKHILSELYIPDGHRCQTLLTKEDIIKIMRTVDVIAKSDIIIQRKRCIRRIRGE